MTAEEARLDTVQQVLDLLRIPQIYATSIANYNQVNIISIVYYHQSFILK